MPRNDKPINDLEYLAHLGYESVPTSGEEINLLKKKVRSKAFSYNSGFHFGIICLLTGLFLGVSVFFLIVGPPDNFEPPRYSQHESRFQTVPEKIYNVQLDTVKIHADNFVNPSLMRKREVRTTPGTIDTIEMAIASIPASTLITTIPATITEAEIQYIPNSPIIFLHDLKITDYSTLYFRQNKFVSLTIKPGLDASYANPNEAARNENVLNSSPTYYLHQAISDAMLYFSRKEYMRCLSTLNTVLEINPGDINCQFYEAMCYFYLKNYTAAVPYFENCINNPNNSFLNEARYYKAYSLYQAGEKEEAVELFKEIAAEGSFYSEKARTFLK